MEHARTPENPDGSLILFHIKIGETFLILEALPYRFQGIFGKCLSGISI